MRNILLLLLLLISAACYSQDVIKKMDGGEITCKIRGFDSVNVRYSPFDYQDEYIFTISITEVFELRYKDGRKVFLGGKPPRIENMNSPGIERSYTKYDSLMKRSREYKALGVTSAICGPLLLVGGCINLAIGVKNDNKTSIIAGSGLIVAGTIFTILAPVYVIKSKEEKDIAQRYKPAAYIQPAPVINFAGANKLYGVRLTITL